MIGVLLLAVALSGLLAQSSPTVAAPHPLDGRALPALPSATPLTAWAHATPVTPLSPTPAAVRILNAPLSAQQGERVTLQAQAAPDTECSIQIGYAGAPDLDTATSDSSGSLSWTWRVGRKAPTGSWPITVSCGNDTARTSLIVS